MWECEYSREPVDYRLIWLRFLRKIWIVPVAVLAGIVLVGAIYYYARTGARGGRTYQAESVFYIGYGDNKLGEDAAYYNSYTWGEVIHTDFFMDQVCEKMSGELSREELEEYITASVDSDVRYLYVRCDTHSPELSVRLASLMEEVVPRFADTREEIDSIEVAKAGNIAKDSSKIWLGNALFLGGCLGLFISIFGILTALVIDTAVYLPATVEKRYGLTCLGAVFMPEFVPNCDYYLKGASKIAVVYADESFQESGLKFSGSEEREIISCQNPVTHPEELDRIRDCDRMVLCLNAGCKNDEIFRRLLEQMSRQKIKITAAILNSADEKLISAYYRSNKG